MKRTKFTANFERFLLQKLITDDKIFKSRIASLKPEFFEDSAKRHQICSLIREHHKRFGKRPSFDYLADKLLQLDNQLSEDCLDELESIESLEAEYTDEEFTELFNQFIISRQVQGVLLAAVDDLEAGNLEQIPKRINDLWSKQQAISSGGMDYFSAQDQQRAVLEAPPRIPTPWSTVNQLMHGGLGGGELGIIMGPSGTFKTQILLHMVKGALISGIPIVYFSLEVSEFVLSCRMHTMFTGLPLEVVREFPEEVELKLERLKRYFKTSVILKQYPMRTASVANLRAFVSDKQLEIGDNVGMVIIDYPDLLATPTQLAKNTLPATELYTQIRSWAVEDNIPIWVASQTNKNSSGKPLVRKEDVAEDWQKIAIADVAITLNMTEEEFNQNSLRLFFAKSRNSTPFIQVPLVFTKPGYNFKEDL